MNSRRHRLQPDKKTRVRHGLAPVELVLALPVWMLLAAVMVLVGTTAVWKLRLHVAAREAAMQSRWPSSQPGVTTPEEWFPAGAAVGTNANSSLIIEDPTIEHPVVRGPQLIDPLTRRQMAVNGDPLTLRPRMTIGTASLDHPPAVWSRSGYRYRIDREFPILRGDAGQFSLQGSDPRRSLKIWNMDHLLQP